MVEKRIQSPDYAAEVLDFLEAIPMRTLLFKRADHSFDHHLLLRVMRRVDLLAQPVASYHCGVAARREDQPVIGSQQERYRHAAQRSDASDQGLFQCATRSPGLTAARQCQPSNSRVRHSITSASIAQPSCLVQRRQRSVDQCSLGLVATDGSIWIGRPKPLRYNVPITRH